MLRYGADIDTVDQFGNTALHVSEERWKYYTVILLINHNASLDKQNNCGETSLLCALRKEKTDVSQILIESGADVNKADYSGYSPLHVSASFGFYDSQVSIPTRARVATT